MYKICGFILRNWLVELWELTSLVFAGVQAGRLVTQAEFLCYSLEAEFVLFRETSTLALRPSPDQMRPTHTVGDLLYLKSTDCRC